MAGRRKALIVAIDEYEHPGLRRLVSPAADAGQLAAVLGDPRVGDFEVEIVHNEPAHAVEERIEDLFADARADDVLLVHFSGHGLKGEAGDLYFAARNTRPDRLASTAVPADFVQRCLRSSPSRSIVLLLDCCYGGAFGQGVAVRAAGDVNVLDSFPSGRPGGGRGRAVITASSAMEYAFEGERLADDSRPLPSPFTAALVHGLGTGEADRDEDGWVSLNELYDYVFDRVRETNPQQTPSRDIEMQGELFLARSGRRRVKPATVPLDLRAAMEDANPYTRLGAVAELRARLVSENLPVALGAHEALAGMAETDSRVVADAAGAALREVTLRLSPLTLDFGQIPAGTPSSPRRIDVAGPPIARSGTVRLSEPWIRLSETAGGYDVSVVPPGRGRAEGTVTVGGPAGEAQVVVTVEGVAPDVPDAVPAPRVPTATPVPTTSAPATPRTAPPVASASTAPTPASVLAPAPPPVAAEAAEVPGPRRPGDVRQRRLVLGGALAAIVGILLVFVQPSAWAADGWTRPVNLTSALVLVVGGLLATGPETPARLGAGAVLGGAAAALWAAVLTAANMAAYGLEYAPQGWMQLVLAVLAVLAAALVTPGRLRSTAYRPGLFGPGRLRAVVVGAGLLGGVALLVQAVALGSALGGDSGYEYLLWPSFLAVALAVALPWWAARVVPSPFAAGLLAGWPLGIAGPFAVFFSLVGYSGHDVPYVGYDVFLATLLVLVGAAVAVLRTPGGQEGTVTSS